MKPIIEKFNLNHLIVDEISFKPNSDLKEGIDKNLILASRLTMRF